jgi:hypothetical protein
VDGTTSLAFLERVRAQALRAKFTLPASCLPSPADPAR